MSILKLENICYQYDGNKKQVLKDINFEFEKGKIYAIVGQSGAGKTAGTASSGIRSASLPRPAPCVYQTVQPPGTFSV